MWTPNSFGLQVSTQNLNQPSIPLTPRRSPRLNKKASDTSSTKPSVKRRLIAKSNECDKETRFDWIINSLDSHLIHNFRTEDTVLYLEISRLEADIQKQFGGPSPGARVVLSESGECFFQVHGGKKVSTDCNVFENSEALDDMLQKLAKHWHFCNGIPHEIYRKNSQNIWYHPKHYSELNTTSVYSDQCERWFYGKKARTSEVTGVKSCSACNSFFRSVRRSNARNTIGNAERLARLEPKSKFPLKYLSPLSKKARQRKIINKRVNEKRSKKTPKSLLEKTQISLEECQNNESCDIESKINGNLEVELEKIWSEAEQTKGKECRDLLEEIWRHDTMDRQAFYSDQSKNVSGHKGNTWSTITYRLALAIYSRSPSAYEALKSFKILQLPSSSSLKSFRAPCLHKPGIHEDIQDYVLEQSTKYCAYQEEMERRGNKKPLGEGILIFDEVKVTAKVKWSSSGQNFFGLALSDEEFPLLHDIYQAVDPMGDPLPTEYNLQFLWRDLTSDFDVIGPYFSSAISYDHRFVIASVTETMRLMHSCDFLIVGLVCDGASTNLAAIKLLCLQRRGAFGSDDALVDKHKVTAWFANFFMPQLNVYCCICPSHQLKNMINALFQSRDTAGGTKLFKTQQDLPYFGWRQIKDMYNREEERINRGQLRAIPGLLRSHIERDAWTKLAVFPAKIMQVSYFLLQIFHGTFCQIKRQTCSLKISGITSPTAAVMTRSI